MRWFRIINRLIGLGVAEKGSRNRMRFLWITRQVPLNPESGLEIYSNGLIRGLLNTGSTGTLVAYHGHNAKDLPFIAGLEVKAVEKPHRFRPLSLLSGLQSDAWSHVSEEFVTQVQEALLQRPEAIFIDYFSTGWILPIIRQYLAAADPRPVLVHVSHNYESKLRFEVANSVRNPVLRMVLRHDARKARKMEQDLVATSDLLVVITNADKNAFEADVPDKQIVTLTPAYSGEICPPHTSISDVPRRAIVVGAFDWIAKQQNLRRFLAIAEGPFTSAAIELLVVGRGPEAFFQEMSARYQFCKFTGRVEDVKPYLSGRIGIMPDDIGGGFKLKYLDYIFNGLCIATIRSQTAGLPVDIDHDLISADTMEGLVVEIVRHIDDLPTLEGMRQRCFEACAQAFSWEERAHRLIAGIGQIKDRVLTQNMVIMQ